MPIVHITDMLQHAYANNYAIGAFNPCNLEVLNGVITAAEHCRAPLILNILADEADNAALIAACETAAMRAQVPVALQFELGRDVDSAVRAINAGCNGVMLNTAQLDFPHNVELTRRTVAMANACGVAVEGCLGYIACNPDLPPPSDEELSLTSIAEAKAYVEKVKVDALAVAIANHVAGKRPRLDYQRLKQINEALNLPLVIHGSEQMSDDQYRRVIAQGVAKINYASTTLSAAFFKHTNISSLPLLNRALSQHFSHEAERLMRLWGAAGRAAEVVAQCRPWLPVEHVIVYNINKLDDGGADAMMREGQRVLSTIPGVRQVVCGKAIKQDAQYHYTWLVRFCHPAVIDSYRDHPLHVDFANQRFRPVAGERITIDYQTFL
jgi:fructose-bisphosphate aldolase, class II